MMVPSDGYKSQVPAGWLSLIVNAGDGIDLDMFLSKQPKEQIIQKVGQQLRINRSRIKDASDTNTDFDDIDSAIRSGYFLLHHFLHFPGERLFCAFIPAEQVIEYIHRKLILIVRDEPWDARCGNEEAEAISQLQGAVRTAANYLRQCGNEEA